MRRFGLIEFPLTHSFSQKYFTAKFKAEGITDCVYDLFPIRDTDELRQILDVHADLRGLNVTIPHKRSVLACLDNREGIPEGVEACNCIRIERGRTTGFNTDLLGFEKSLVKMLKPQHRTALVLGNGGASEAVVHVLKKLGIGCEIVSRELHRGSTLTYRDLDAQTISGRTLIVNTTPLGMFPDTGRAPALPYEAITPDHYLFDLVYNPEETLFLKKGREQGAVTRNGYEMLVIQAEESWKIWNQ